MKVDNNLIKEVTEKRQMTQTTTKIFKQLEIHYNAKWKLEEIESQEAIELAKIE